MISIDFVAKATTNIVLKFGDNRPKGRGSICGKLREKLIKQKWEALSR